MKGHVVTMTTGKGGVGKIMSTPNLAIAQVSMRMKVVCIDSDIGLRNLGGVMGLENRIIDGLEAAIIGHFRLNQAMIRDRRSVYLHLIPAAQTRVKSTTSPWWRG